MTNNSLLLDSRQSLTQPSWLVYPLASRLNCICHSFLDPKQSLTRPVAISASRDESRSSRLCNFRRF